MIAICRVRFDLLSATDRSRHFDEMTSVVARAITPTSDRDDSWAARDWSARRDSVTQSSLAYEARRNGELVGFITYKVERLAGRPLVHLEAACVIPELQSTGLSYQMTARILLRTLIAHPFKGLYIGGHVINPVALNAWMSRTIDPRNRYPHIGDVPPPSDSLVSAALEFAEREDPDCQFDKATGVVTGKHLPGSRISPLCGDPAVDEHYRQFVDPYQGDTVLMLLDGSPRVVIEQVGEVRRSIRRLLRAKLRREVA